MTRHEWLITIVGALIGVPLGILAIYLWELIQSKIRQTHNAISITRPLQAQVLQDPQPMFPGNPLGPTCYPVAGTLGFLPEGHQVWLLVQDPLSKLVWPQGFSSVAYTPWSGTWEGLILPNHRMGNLTTIIAVVAPPSAQKKFADYQMHGSENGWQPLDHIPEECKNLARVDAKVP